MNRREALAEARFCVRSAEDSSDPEYRSALLELAGWWSQQADSSSRADSDRALSVHVSRARRN
jgi:hypothetical protein